MLDSIDAIAEFMHAPNPWKAAAGAHEAEHANLQWARDTDLIRTEDSASVLTSWNIAHSAAAAFPRARGNGLLYVAKWITWGVVFDDMFGKGINTPSHAMAVLDHTTTVLHADTRREPPVPLLGCSKALLDYMAEGDRTMSATWMARWRHSVHTYFSGIAAKYAATLAPAPPTLDQIRHIRQRDIAMYMYADLIEFFDGFELPGALAYTPVRDRMYALLAQAIAYQNDLFSAYRDQKSPSSTDTALNSVLTIARTRNIPFLQAAVTIRDLYLQRERELHRQRDTYLDQARALGYDKTTIERLAAHTDSLVDLVPGVFWGHVATAKRGYLNNAHLTTSSPELVADYDQLLAAEHR
ncbi:hypothetical protein AB0I68_30135 [Streptomyces sp. NPDC050448]|uniref:terpene synthase family protein n=1 Tax=Streptomyces sp. NPDC050448 TaxID=3155404 RepID=UPI00342DF75F